MKKIQVAIAILFCTNTAIAQGTAEDYRRTFSLGEEFSANKVFYSNANPQWIGETPNFWYVRNTPEGRIYALVNAEKKSRKDHNIYVKEAASGEEHPPPKWSEIK